MFELPTVGGLTSEPVVHPPPSRPRPLSITPGTVGRPSWLKTSAHTAGLLPHGTCSSPPSLSRFKVLPPTHHFDNNDNLPVRTGPAG
ncbi:hypothetical protein CDV55_108006 [Aspergillus turcosus]|nr:hypothetical protein CDV55_108006 [Aspergillus turcosus]